MKGKQLLPRRPTCVLMNDTLMFMYYYRVGVAYLLLMTLIIGFLLTLNLSLVLPVLLR